MNWAEIKAAVKAAGIENDEEIASIEQVTFARSEEMRQTALRKLIGLIRDNPDETKQSDLPG